MEAIAISKVIPNPDSPIYSFPEDEYDKIFLTFDVWQMLAIAGVVLILGLSILGYIIGHGTCGDKRRLSTMVEAVDEDNPELVSVESRKKTWAQYIYCFSITKNF